MKQQSHSGAGMRNAAAPSRSRLMALTILFSLMLAFTAFAGAVAASQPARQLAQAEQTPSAALPITDDSVPPATGNQPVGTAVAPDVVQTGLPVPVQTGVAPEAIETTQAAVREAQGQDAPPPVQGDNPAAPGQAASQQSGFPWPWVVLAAMLALVIAGVMLMRTRRTTPQTATVVQSGSVQPYGAPASSARVGSSGAPTTPIPVAPFAAPVGAEATVETPAPPSTVACPNCGTSNDFSENFCHECGQDLRPTRAQMVAALAPPPAQEDVVTEDTPYLETLDRIDEQLEYVLARPKIAVGTAPGNDIVVDSSFKGWEQVSPVHAELRREQEGFVIVDKDSASGTFVNEMRTGENILADGDMIRLGGVRFIFHIPSA
ncbi:MAG TPA: FHA domain-containing protein [Chloroflexia bacterium]|nr:FHA domain-containing protein [Chloroflexia bacterium]